VTFDLSQKMGMMATGGAEGKLLIIDPYAFGLLNSVVANKHSEIVSLFFYDNQNQIITVSGDRTICLWDAFRLEKI
jgi:WD40 repeat protein